MYPSSFGELFGATDTGQKTYRKGTHRTVSPSDTIAKVRTLMPEMGITRVANVTGLDRIGIPVTMVVRPNSRSVSVSQGKGLTLEGAKASGLMESTETFHAERIDLPLEFASYTDMGKRFPVIEVDSLPRMVNSRFRPDDPIQWIESRNLRSGESTWLPYELVHTNYTLPALPGSGCFVSSSNGLASGNHILEAILHGICEVVERDSSSVWHFLDPDSRAQTRIDIDTVTDPHCRYVIEKLEEADFDICVWDTTTNVGIASMYCTITDKREGNAHPGVGAGCHPLREIALLRALLEAVQVRTTYISGSRDDLSRSEYETRAMVEKRFQIDNYARGNGSASGHFDETPSHDSETFEQDLEWVMGCLSQAGIDDVFVVDLTRSEYEIPVARVVIPGLEGPHDDNRYVPGSRIASLLESRGEQL